VIWTGLAVVLIGGALLAAAAVTHAAARRLRARADETARQVLEDAEARARLRQQEAEVEIEEKRAAAESRFETQTRRRRQDLQQLEERLREQERNLGRRLQLLSQKEQDLETRDARFKARETEQAERERQAQALIQESRQRLERQAGLTAPQARRELIREIETEARQQAANLVHRIEEEAREAAGSRARRLVIEAIQRIPARDVLDNVVTLVRLPNDEMKGRVIGREGRNIRAFEMATGVDLIIDETPQVILLSSFDPLRRAIAQMALERLIEDGRIHPARIEETVTRARDDLEAGLEPGGEAAAFSLGITGLSPRLTRLLGRLHYRVIQGYNLLDHSLSVARVGAGMATLLGIPPDPLKRAGLLHEVGHAEEGDANLHPLLVSADLLGKLGEDSRVVEAIRALHTAVADPSPEAVLLRAAENLVLNRPGERDEHLMSYVERLQQLEDVAGAFTGVRKAYAMRAGKEVRVIVEAAQVGDDQVSTLSRDIATRIEKDVKYPGMVKVSVIRETRAVDYAT